jgi:NAD(P)-dependent dehydrogenase (short-subunit alcohol dehydrogenase family)
VKDSVTVNVVSPSFIGTEMIGARRDEYAQKVPLGRLGLP